MKEKTDDIFWFPNPLPLSIDPHRPVHNCSVCIYTKRLFKSCHMLKFIFSLGDNNSIDSFLGVGQHSNSM